MKKYTLSDIASAAMVSKTTVSNYLNGHFDEMSEQTAARIQQAISKVGYRPSIIASSLKNNHNRLIGVILTHTKTTMARYLIHQLCIYCQERHYHPLFTSIEDNEENEIDCIRHLIDYSVCGIISITGTTAKYLEKCSRPDIPFVACDRPVYGVNSVYMDYKKSVDFLLNTAVASGCESFSMFTINTKRMPQSTVLIRERAYSDFCESNGIEKNIFRIEPDNIEHSIISSLDKYLHTGNSNNKMVFVSNPPLLTQTDQTCLKLGLRCGEAVSLYGYFTSSNAFDIGFYPDTNIKSVIAPPIDKMAENAIDILISSNMPDSSLRIPQTIVLEPIFLNHQTM